MENQQPGRDGFFAPLGDPNVRLYLCGQVVSLVGTFMQVTAQGWLVWQLSHSTVDLGRVGMIGTLPFLVLGPFAGAWADRLERRRVLIGTQLVAMGLAFALATLVATGAVQLWHVYVLAGMLGVVNAFDMPAQQAFIGDLAGVERIRSAVVLNNMAFQASRMMGPALAGWVIGQTSLATAFWLNGASFVPVIASLALVRARQERSASEQHPLEDFREGVGFLSRSPRLQDLLALTLLCTFLGIANGQVMPSLVTDTLHGDSATLGYLLGASGAGSLSGSLLLLPLSHRAERIGAVMLAAVAWSGAWFAVLSLSNWIPLSLAAIYLASMTIPVVMSNASGLLQLLAPPEMRARLVSVWLMVGFGAQPLAALFIGYNARWSGTPAAIGCNGLLMVGGALLLALLRRELSGWRLDPAKAA